MIKGHARVIVSASFLIAALVAVIVAIAVGRWVATADHDPSHWDAQVAITGDLTGESLNSGVSTLGLGIHPDAGAGGDALFDEEIPPDPQTPNIVYFFDSLMKTAGRTSAISRMVR